MKKFILFLALILSSFALIAQTPMDIYAKHRPYYSENKIIGTDEFQWFTKSKAMIQDCDLEYLVQMGMDRTYFDEFKIIEYIAVFKSNTIDFEQELNLSCYIEVNSYKKGNQCIKVYRQVRLNMFEEIVSVSSETTPVSYTLIYVKGIKKQE